MMSVPGVKNIFQNVELLGTLTDYYGVTPNWFQRYLEEVKANRTDHVSTLLSVAGILKDPAMLVDKMEKGDSRGCNGFQRWGFAAGDVLMPNGQGLSELSEVLPTGWSFGDRLLGFNSLDEVSYCRFEKYQRSQSK